MGHALRELAVVGEEDQALGVEVEPAHRDQRLAERGGMRSITVGRPSGSATVDMTPSRLVEQEVVVLALCGWMRLPSTLIASSLGIGLLAQLRDLAVDRHPALAGSAPRPCAARRRRRAPGSSAAALPSLGLRRCTRRSRLAASSRSAASRRKVSSRSSVQTMAPTRRRSRPRHRAWPGSAPARRRRRRRRRRSPRTPPAAAGPRGS